MTRKTHRLLPALLALAMLFSLLPVPDAQAASGTTGSISATVRIDYSQSLEELESRNLQAELLQGKTLLGTIDLTDPGQQSLSGGHTALVSHRDASGGALIGEWPGYLDFTVDGLPLGTYTLRFTGRGYVTYEQDLRVAQYSHHLTVGTGDATFTLGDVNSDGRVDEDDLERLSAALGSELRRDLDTYDLNGDRAIDIVDLSYLHRLMKATGGSEDRETALLAPTVDTAALKNQLAGQGVTVTSGDLEDLFVENGRTVTLTPNSEGLIVLPLEFRQATEMAEVRIVSPASAAPLAGTVEVEDQRGNVTRHSFDRTVPEGVQTLSLQEESAVISIDLGKRVAVKKVTVTVTKTAAGYATVESIQFLKEMIPVDPEAASSQIKGLTAAEGSEKVTLTWNSLPNISGYRVTWWPVNDPSKTQQKTVETNRLEVTGLENLVAYSFTVTAVDGDWSGKPSAPVTATPQPVKAPDPPDMVNVSALDGALRVSWKAAKSATYYEVYYTDVPNAPVSAYARWGGTLTGTNTTITGLTNDTAYSIYIIAGNDAGRSGPSRVSTGTPKAVLYARPEGIPTQGVLDYRDFQDIRLAAPGNWSRTECPAFTPRHMADGDYRTQWTVQNWWGNEHVVVTFREPQDLTAAIWVPRLDGSYPSNLRAYSVLVWLEGDDLSGPGRHVTPGTDNNGNTDGGDVHTWPSVRGNPAVNKFAILPFQAQKKVVRISVAVEQSAYTQVSLSELMFMKYDEDHRLPDDIAELFADELRTKLSSAATRERIDQLQARLDSGERDYYLEVDALADELALARELLEGRTGSSVFLDGIDSRSGGRDSKNYGQSGSALQPLGAAAAANSEITIYAQGIPEGETVTVYATQYNAEASAWQASMGTLENGRNVLSVPKIGSQNTPRGGSLYLSYSGTGAEGIRLHVRRGTAIPVLDASDWGTMSDAAKAQAVSAYLSALDAYLSKTTIGGDQTDWRNVTEIATPSVLLSLPAKAVHSGLGGRATQLISSIDAWEEVMDICRTVQGISGEMETRQNIRCMQMFSGAFMYAAGSHIGIGYGSCAGMVGGAPVRQLAANASANRLFGWGIAHEIGHNMDKLGKAEITNNIYALAVQTYDGKQNILPSRLEKSNKYAAIFNKTAQGHPGASNDVFVQLGMYWQLHLAYDGGEKPLDFYTRFFTAWKKGTYFDGASTYDEKVALTASAVAGKDLSEFFTRWGMTLSETVTAKLATTYPDEARALWYLNDQSRRDRLAEVPAAKGDVSAAAVKKGDKDVELTFGTVLSNKGKVQGYEIRRDGTPIAFTTGTSYTDTIGTGNNRTYTYTVTAYDTLGNKIGEARTQEVRIAYDLTLDAKDYTADLKGGTLRAGFPKATAVTGLKLPAGIGIDGLEVSVTEGQKETAVKLTVDKDRTDSVIAYFQRPNADDSQASQVWTYQATALTVSGLPATLKMEDVQLISYMGDDIAFLSGPTVGVMGQDFRYGSGADEVIKAGTLIVTGTYRGDPTYNTVRIQGDFAAPDMSAANGDQDPETPVQDIRDINGTAILFANESSDKTYTNISDGIFLFIPDVQREAELTGDAVSCGAAGVLPSRIRAELWRTMEPDSTVGTRRTAQTLWISSPGGDTLPTVEVKGGGQ